MNPASFATKIRTALALGLGNIVRAIFYRMSVKLNLNPVRRIKTDCPRGPFFLDSDPKHPYEAGPSQFDQLKLFSHLPLHVEDSPPKWLANPITGTDFPTPDKPWWQIPDFDPRVGDIKLIWELSRMDWVLCMARSSAIGNPDALERLDSWMTDWCEKNPPYIGPNWKCGQEASIRVIHLSCAATILRQDRNTSKGLLDLIAMHLKRIAPTIQYAIAQDNNHGTSEATALFVGGSWLASSGDIRGHKWASLGRSILENRVRKLVGAQGTFSQYSVNYHRLMLDSICYAEWWRARLQLPKFSRELQERMAAAAKWLHAITDPESGDGPNIGANDGARLLQLAPTAYRDFRPTIQLAFALFVNQAAYSDGPWNALLRWLEIEIPKDQVGPPHSLDAADGGFAILRQDAQMAVLRYPRFRFRPSHSDALHLDFWVGSQNALRDSGTYSYNADEKWTNYFSGVGSHNTIQFDQLEQMPRLSRFLFGNWLRTNALEPMQVEIGKARVAAGYQHSCGASHFREVELTSSSLVVKDTVRGFQRSAVQRWRLAPGKWRISPDAKSNVDFVLQNELGHRLTLSSSCPIGRCELVEGWESRHYLEKNTIPVVELEISTSGTLTSEYTWNA